MTQLQKALATIDTSKLIDVWEKMTPHITNMDRLHSIAVDIQLAIMFELRKRDYDRSLAWITTADKTNLLELSPRAFFYGGDISDLVGLVVMVPRCDIEWAEPVKVTITSAFLRNGVELNVMPGYANGYATTLSHYNIEDVTFTGEKI